MDHCHGTLVEHVSGLIECTDPGCLDLGDERHTLVIDCESVDGGCGCTAHSQSLSQVNVSPLDMDRAVELSPGRLLRAS